MFTFSLRWLSVVSSVCAWSCLLSLQSFASLQYYLSAWSRLLLDTPLTFSLWIVSSSAILNSDSSYSMQPCRTLFYIAICFVYRGTIDACIIYLSSSPISFSGDSRMSRRTLSNAFCQQNRKRLLFVDHIFTWICICLFGNSHKCRFYPVMLYVCGMLLTGSTVFIFIWRFYF